MNIWFETWLRFHFLSVPLLWLGFILFFNQWAEQTSKWDLSVFNPLQKILGAVFVATDAYVDITWGTLLFWQKPSIKRLMLSSRMDDLIVNGSGWRRSIALQVVGRLLEPFDKSIPKQHSTYGFFKP